MMRKTTQMLLLVALLALILSGCGRSEGVGSPTESAADVPSHVPASFPAETVGSKAPAPSGSASPASVEPDRDQALREAARDVVDILRDRDLDHLAEIVDPELGLRFSPYAHIEIEASQRFDADKLPEFKQTTELEWGAYDGSGDPILLSFRDYFEKFVYDQDFASAPDVSLNELKGQGNVPFNGPDVYPGSSYVEFHFPGFDSQYEGMDWESLILILRLVNGDWKLCAIVHAGWTV
jgi:predicted small secreted protein